jgi:hypothetical protein
MYQWTQLVEIAAGRDESLELTADNAEVEPAPSATTTSAAPLQDDPAFLLPQWQDSVVALWTPSVHATGFVVDARGLVVTNQRVIGDATSVEVQLTPAVKVAGRVLAADPVRNVAVLWIDSTVIGSVRPAAPACEPRETPPIEAGQEIFAITALRRGPKRMTSGIVSRIERQGLVSDLRLADGSTGGPVFRAGGAVVGLTSVPDEIDVRRGLDTPVVRVDDICEVMGSAQKKMQDAERPSGTHLPVEPARPFPADVLEDVARGRAGGLSPYQMSSSGFDVTFITPVLVYAAQHDLAQGGGRTRDRDPRTPDPLLGFANWSEYVADVPPVLLVRVTPKLVEGFWTMVARGAARTQGISLPPIKRFKPGFARMRAFCGDTEVTPIHPFKIEQRVSDSDAIHEGLYAFEPGAFGPQCGTVKLMLYSEKEPDKGDTRVVDPRVVEQIWQDFAPYRALEPSAATLESYDAPLAEPTRFIVRDGVPHRVE